MLYVEYRNHRMPEVERDLWRSGLWRSPCSWMDQLQDCNWLAIKGLQEGKFHNFTWQIVPMSNHLEGKKFPDIHAEISVFYFVSIFYLVLSLGNYWKETGSICLIWSFTYMDEIPLEHFLSQPRTSRTVLVLPTFPHRTNAPVPSPYL